MSEVRETMSPSIGKKVHSAGEEEGDQSRRCKVSSSNFRQEHLFPNPDYKSTCRRYASAVIQCNIQTRHLSFDL